MYEIFKILKYNGNGNFSKGWSQNLSLGYTELYTNGGISEYCMLNNSKNYNYS